MTVVPLSSLHEIKAIAMALVALEPATLPSDDGDVEPIDIPTSWHCRFGPRHCVRCVWSAYSTKWSEKIAFVHDPHVSPICSTIERNKLQVGCTACRSARTGCSFSKFKVEALSCFQISYWWRHVRSSKHIAACKSQGIQVNLHLMPGDQHLKTRAAAPPLSVMLWGLRLTFSSCAFQDYAKFMETSKLSRDPDTLMTGSWKHSRTAKKANNRSDALTTA